ncbi:hypothetical protein F5884DRAFT_226970 [Xylogone sp. PMI_703]|nr:hypothetical protein F5884DRAFT_226970 [Xylogone sp. PMI_703]
MTWVQDGSGRYLIEYEDLDGVPHVDVDEYRPIDGEILEEIHSLGLEEPTNLATSAETITDYPINNYPLPIQGTIEVQGEASTAAAAAVAEDSEDDSSGEDPSSSSIASESAAWIAEESQPTRRREYVCEVCKLTFWRKVDLNHHMKNHDKPYICPHCERGFATTRILDRHINDRHDQTESYFCREPDCRRRFPREENCRRHMQLLHGYSPEQAWEVDMDDATRLIRERRRLGGGGRH